MTIAPTLTRRRFAAPIRPSISDFPASFPSPAASSRRCIAGGCGRCGSTPGSASAAESNARYRYLLAQGVSGLSVAFDLPTQIGLRLRPSAGAGRSRPRRRGDRFDRGHGRALRRDPARSRVDVDDDQRDGDHPARAVRRRREDARASPLASLSGTVQNDILKEYIARGTYIYPPRASLRIVTDIFAFCERELPQLEHDLDQRLSHSRSRLDGGAGGRLHLRERHRLRAGGDRRRPRRQPLRPAALVLLQRPQRFSRGDRQVSRGAAAVGAHHARPLRRDESARAAAAFSHADGRQHADRAAARQQHRARRRSRRWPRCSAERSRCTATGATRRWRCRRRNRRASRCARSRSSPPKPASPTRVDPVRRVVCDRRADRTDRGGARARCSSESRRRAERSPRSSTGMIQREIQESAYRAQQEIDRGDRVVVGVNRFAHRRDGDRSRCFASIPQSSGGRWNASRAVRASRDRDRHGARRSTPSPRPHGRQPTSCRRSSPPSKRAQRSARLPTRMRGVFGEHKEIDV